jgi:hypothetical protein
MRSARFEWIWCAVLMLGLGSACTAAESGTAQISIALHGTSQPSSDAGASTAPADGEVVQAVVTVDRVYLQPADDVDDGSGRIVLADQPVVVDFTNLSAATTDLVRGASVPVGLYSQLRFVISGGFIQVAGVGIFATPDYPSVPAGSLVAGELRMPSFGSSGLKVNLPDGGLMLGSGEHRILRVDFDVAQSFGHDTGSTAWVMHPVIVATDVTATANVVVNLDTSLRTLPVAPPIIAELSQSTGALVEALELVPSGTAAFSGTFVFVDPTASPFALRFHDATSAIATDPPTPHGFSLASGEGRVIDFQALP